jgi:glucosyl-dolichyl phosphate glucuronosyltransferase
MGFPFVSVIVATRNRAGLLAQTLDALVGQRWPRDRFEILVADNASPDDTAAVVGERAARPDAPDIHYLYVAESGKSSAVNRALGKAKGVLLAFTDDDVLPEPTWIERLVAAFDDSGADFAAGRILPRWEEAPPSWMSPALYGVLAIPDNGETRLTIGDGANAALIPIGANMAVRRRVIDHVGGLHPDLGKLAGTLRTGEDHEFFLRMLHAGYRGVYEPTAVVRHWVPRDRLAPAYIRRWLYQNGQDVARVERAYPPAVPRFCGVPRYLFRRAAADAWTALRTARRGAQGRSFAALMRVLWFAGYLREAWRSRAGAARGDAGSRRRARVTLTRGDAV